MKYLKQFNQASEYEVFKESEDYVLPNVSYVVETKGVSYAPKKAFKLRAKYNATPDNLVAFTGASNIKSLKVNGTSIEFEPIKNEIASFDVLGENISLDLETGEVSFPESYLIKSPVSSWSFKAKDPNYAINENTFVCMLGMQDGMLFANPITLEEAMNSKLLTTNDGVTLEMADEFFAELNANIQSGLQIGFTLADIDEDNNTFMFIDTEHQTKVTTGGSSNYSFDAEGIYDVEIELADPDMKGMRFAKTPLISVEIGDGITSIGNNAFQNCSSLISINIPDSVNSIGDYAFYDCSGLTSITIPNSVTSIGEGAFRYCSGLTSITIPNSVTSIGEGAFRYCSGLTSITIPNSVTSIGNYAFHDCSGLTSITIPDSVTTIGNWAFANCSGLTSIVIPDSVNSIGEYAFMACKGLTSITIPNSVTSIGNNAFQNCSALTEITIPNSVTSIGDWAFLECTSLKSITCYVPTAPSIQDYTFYDIKSGGTLYVPSGSDYSSWMSGYLGYYDWTIQYI